MKKLCITIFLVGALGILALLPRVLEMWILARNDLKAKTTATRMLTLMSFVQFESPDLLDAATIELIAREHNYEGYHLDGWGRPLLVQRAPTDSGAKYVMISLGQDGTKGPCCTRFVGEDWDADAVLQDDQWLQVWSSE